MATRNDKRSPNIWFRFYWNDYSNKTGHLTLLEHGAYTQLILKYMAAGKPLPEDRTRIFRMIGAVTPEEQAATTSVLNEFFPKEDGTYRSSRCDEELLRISAERQRQSELGKKGGSANSPAQAAYRERGIAAAIENDNQQSSIKTNSAIAAAIDFDTQKDSQQHQSIIGNEQNSQNDDQNAVAVAFLEKKHTAATGTWIGKHRLTLEDLIREHGQEFMDAAIAASVAPGFDSNVVSKFAILVTTRLPEEIAKRVAAKAGAERKRKEDEIQEAAVQRDVQEIVARRDRVSPVQAALSEVNADDLFKD